MTRPRLSTSMSVVRRPRAIFASILSLTILAVALPASAVAAPERERDGFCRAGSEWNLYVGREDGRRLEVDFEVDSERRGERWRVVLKNDGKVFHRSTRRTNQAGEFDIERYTRDGSGKDKIVARAKSLRTGEVCRAVIRI